MPRRTAAERTSGDQAEFAGLKLRAGLPKDNGLSGLAGDLTKDTTRVVYFVGAAKVKDVVRHVESNTDTVVCGLIGVEADLAKDELEAVMLVLDRARVRRTGEEPLFDTASKPADVTELLPGRKSG